MFQSLCFRSQAVRGAFTLVAAFTLQASFARSAFADFSGPYTLTPPVAGAYTHPSEGTAFGTWTYLTVDPADVLGMNSLDTSGAPTTLTLDTYYPLRDTPYDGTMQLTDVAAASGFLSFDYTLTVANGINTAAYSINGVLTYLSPGTGSVENVPLNAGDVFGFYVNLGMQDIHDGITSRAILSVSSFAAPVPEPSGLFTLGMGLAGLGLMRAMTEHKRTGRTAQGGIFAAPGTNA